MTVLQNRLSRETSPYLLQHADNPVDWYPWGEEALSKAKEENKPILLSIGYSACHWCHVMAHESFENAETAALMNEHFVNIKVDREERPDLDQIYQTAVQFFIQRAGGWPLTMFLRPNQVPFHGGTYFPPEDRHRLPGFPSLLVALATAYRERPQEIDATSKNLSQALARLRAQKGGKQSLSENFSKNLLKHAVRGLTEVYDQKHGGFGQAPKFPGTPSLTLLLHHFDQTGDQGSLKMACYSLQQMAWGGMRDQLGGGFHRYSVDRAWQIPHFEKMLYDNAQLAPLYFSAFQATGDAFFKLVGIEVLDDILRDFCDAQGGFYAALDADSEGGEGAFYSWSPDQVTAELDPDKAKRFSAYYDITKEGNFEGLNIPHRTVDITTLAKAHQMTDSAFWQDIQSSRTHLQKIREKRAKPFRDEKIITAWNAQMISAFVAGYQVTRISRYLDAAIRAMAFIDQALYSGPQLLRVYKNGYGKFAAYLDDHSALLVALLDLYEATGNGDYLQKAKTVANVLVEDFWDEAEGGFYYTGAGQEKLIERTKPCYDQSIPSGNATAALAFVRLSRLTGQKELRHKAEQTLRLFAKEMKTQSQAMAAMIAATVCFETSPKKIHVIADPEASETEALLKKLHALFLPNKIVLLSSPGLSKKTPERIQIKGLPTVYLCQNQSCSAAMTDWVEIEKALMRPNT